MTIVPLIPYAGSGSDFTVSQALVSPPAGLLLRFFLSLHCDDVLLIETPVGWPAKESRLQDGFLSSALKDRWPRGAVALWLCC